MPNPREIQAIGAHGATAGVAHRRNLMNAICGIVGIPPGGWTHGQSKLFEGGDVRLMWLLRRLAQKGAAERVARNLGRVSGLSGAETMLAVVTAAREHSSALTDVSSRMIDSWSEGGLDFLWAEKERLGLPKSVTNAWKQVPEFKSPKTGNTVKPALIPARDQVLVYAAQLRASFDGRFRRFLSSLSGPAAATVLASASRPALLIWKAYSFLAPGGAAYDPKRSVAAQSGQRFGSRSALQFLAHRAAGAPLDLNGIISFSELNSVEWVRSSKVRTAEALFLERLLTVTREILPPAGMYD